MANKRSITRTTTFRTSHFALVLLGIGAVAACTTERTNNDDDDETNPGTGGAGATQETQSGTAICNTAGDCATGLNCEHSTLGATGVCATDCTSDADCATGEVCAGGSTIGFDASCLERCTASADCGAGLGCAVLNNGVNACLPFDWIDQPPSGKGLGDACSVNADCKSAMCVGGWCSDYCSASNNGCFGDYDGKNEFGAWNWCVLNNAEQYICFPGCTGQSSVCNNYDSASCQSATDATGSTVSICAG